MCATQARTQISLHPALCETSARARRNMLWNLCGEVRARAYVRVLHSVLCIMGQHIPSSARAFISTIVLNNSRSHHSLPRLIPYHLLCVCVCVYRCNHNFTLYWSSLITTPNSCSVCLSCARIDGSQQIVYKPSAMVIV